MAVSFSKAQTFYIDPGVVQNAPQVGVSAVSLYFQAKPARTENASGINNPGVSIFISETKYGKPIIDDSDHVYARAEYDQIATTSDASLGTIFRFPSPIPLATDREYAIIIMFDGSDQFQLWSSHVGDYLIDKKTISPGPSGNYIGKLFDYMTTGAAVNVGLAGTGGDTSTTNFQSSWTPLDSTDLKFQVFVARYAHNGVPISANNDIPPNVQVIHTSVIKDANGAYLYPAKNMEMVIFSQADSVKEAFVGGQYAYQNTVSYPGGFANGSTSIKISVTGNDRITANTNYPNGVAFSWRDIYPNVGLTTVSNDSPFIVVKTDIGVDVRKVISVVSNTIIQVDEPISFVNSAAEFLLTPVGVVDSFNKAAPFGNFQSILMLSNSSANSSLRFVNNAVESVSIVAGGTGYSNSDILYITGFENVANKVLGGYKGVANLQTNSTGGITALYFSNLGCGFVNTSTMQTLLYAAVNSNPTANTSAGSGANLAVTIGSTIKTEHRNNVFAKTRICNFALSDVFPHFQLNSPSGTRYDVSVKTNYVQEYDAAAYGNVVYNVDSSPDVFTIQSDVFQRNAFLGEDVPTFVSRSNEFNLVYANGAPNDRITTGSFSNTVLLVVNTFSNNDFLCVTVNSTPTLTLGSYVINNDYTNENTDQGNAYARQIQTQIDFGRQAEDLLVYLTAYRPPNTDLKVYARMYNSADPDYFEDKDWTLLAPQFAANLYSSATNANDFVELTFAPQAYPNTDFTSNGLATLTNASAVVTGVGTAFTTNFQSGDLVVMTNTLFANQYILDVVNTVTNATSMTVNNPITNATMISAPLTIKRIRNFKHQAFDYLQNSNIARYYNSQMVPYDTYNIVAIKVVMLSDRPNLVPRIDDTRGVGVSA